MAFHGARGGSRGRGSSSGASRGPGGARGGAGRGRGPGRGSGTRRRGGERGGRRRPTFDSTRLTQQKEGEENKNPESEAALSEDEEDSSEDDSGDDEDTELQPAQKPYATLLQVLAADHAPEAKRRKVEHISQPGSDFEMIETVLGEVNDNDAQAGAEAEEEFPEDIGADEVVDTSDPFEAHFANPDDNILAQRLKCIQQNQWNTQKIMLPKGGRATVGVPSTENAKVKLIAVNAPSDLKLKQKLGIVMSQQKPTFDSLESQVASSIFNYQDVLYCERSPKNAESLRTLICLHAINHVLKTRDRVIKNNARLAKDGALEFRDQGFTRPKVLMILPTREACVKMVNIITKLFEPDQQENRKRFDERFVIKDDGSSDNKAEDYRELFGGNSDETFQVCLKFTRKTINYGSSHYMSDVILASPLGLRLTLEDNDDKRGDCDFLSSIEMVIVDQADALLMQNWEHTEFIVERLNLQPKNIRKNASEQWDISRLRSWYLNDLARHFRQVIALSAFNTPDLNNLFYNHSRNWAGRIKINSTYHGVIGLGLEVQQRFSRLDSSLPTDPDERFTYFTTTIIPTLSREAKDTVGTVVFIPAYEDFVRVRRYMSEQTTLSFAGISEYSEVRDVARARSHFFTGRHSVLLYTGRAHHYFRYQIRGVRKVIMYGLPDNPIFYKEIVGGFLGRGVQDGKLEPGQGSVRVMFSKWDVLKLERIVGTERVGKMLMEKADTFEFS